METPMIYTAILWPLVALAFGVMVFFGFLRWLERDAKTVKELKLELGETQSDWTHKFEAQDEKYERRIGAIERRLNQDGQRNPLGAHYSTRGGG